ncbi:MAG: hypothetical protein ACI84O_000209 [Myxococcota bacterium]|jgi:hypothetical protein
MKLQRSAARESQHGVVLIMTLFTLFIVIALITQLSLGSEVLYQASNNKATSIQMNLVGRTSAQELLSLIKDDASGEDSGGGFSSALSGGSMQGAESFGDSLGYAAPGLGGAAGSGGGDEGGEDSEDSEDSAANVDSFEDAWARPMRMQLGDFEVVTFVDDENAKFSLVQLSQKNIEERDEAIARVVRIMDALREDFDDDLSESDARIITEEIVRWLDPDSRDMDWPETPRLSFDREKNEFLLLNSLEELMLIKGISRDLFYDQVRDNDMIAPGLESVFTIYTMPEFADAGAISLEADQAADDSGDSGALDALSDDQADSQDDEAVTNSAGIIIDGEGGMEGVLGVSSAVGLKININTAPRAVVQGLFPTFELPAVKTEALLEWRNEVDEEAAEELGNNEEELEDVELRESIFGVNQDDPKQFFKSLADIEKVDGFSSDSLEPETQTQIEELLGVQSEIFSVYVYVRHTSLEGFDQQSYYHEPPGTVLRLKAVVWRVAAEDGTKLVYLRDWHQVPFTRWRIPDFQRDLPAFEQQEYQ